MSLLQHELVAENLGARVIPFTYPTTIPVERTQVSTADVPENQAAPETEMELGQITVRPHSIEALVKVSNQLLRQAEASELLIRQNLAREIGIKRGRHVLKGTGGVQPLGIMSQATAFTGLSGSAAASGGVPYSGYTELREMRRTLANAENLDGAVRPGWALSHDVVEAIHRIESEAATSGTVGEVTRKLFSDANETRVLGYPFAETGLLAGGAASELIFGDWFECIIAEFGNLVIAASRETSDAFAKRQTHILAYEDIDVVVARPDAFVAASNWDLSGL